MLHGKRSSQYWVLLKRLGLVLGLMTFYRGLFYFLYRGNYLHDSPLAIAGAFLSGLRFDLATIALVNAPFIAFSLVPFKTFSRRRYQKFLKAWFLVTNLSLLAASVVDLEYFKFTGARMTADIFYVASEVAGQTLQFFAQYWHLFALFGLTAVFMYAFYPRYFKDSFKRRPRPRAYVWRTGVVLATAIAIRAGLQLKVSNQDLGPLASNSGYTLLYRTKLPAAR